MPKIENKNNENFETLINTFKRSVSKDGDIQRVRERSVGFMSKSLKRKFKDEKARRKR